MFWTYNTSPQIDIILCKEDLTLQELLDQENVLQELKAQNLKLVEFLIKPEILRELVTLITTEPSPDKDLADQYKYPNLACELLTSDLPALNERLASEDILNKLYCFLQKDRPLNPLLSSYFSRTLSILISRKTEQNWFSYQYTCLQALEFLKTKEEFMELLLRHMGTSSIMDLTHNLITLIEGPDLKRSLWNWLQSQNVIPSLINLLNSHSDIDCQINAASVICSITQKLRENLVDMNDKSESDPILQLLESAQIVDLLLNTIFNGDVLCDTAVESGVNILLTLIQPYLPGEAQCRQLLNYTVHEKTDNGLSIPINNIKQSENIAVSETKQSLSQFVTSILPYVKKLKDVLLNTVKTEPIKLANGITSLPLGKSRYLVAKLLSALIALNSSEINKEIMHCDIPELLLDLFYAYSSNNFLHTEVEKLIAYAIDHFNGYVMAECNDDLLLSYLLKECNLLKRILDIWKENDDGEKRGITRRGYMGHVIRIATLIHIENENYSTFKELLMTEVSSDMLEEWDKFVNETLKEIMVLHSSCLGGIRPKLCQSNENSFEENISNKDYGNSNQDRKFEFKDFEMDDDSNVLFSNDPSLYNMGDELYSNINNDLLDEEDNRQAELFSLVCAQKWQSFNKGLDSLADNEDLESEQQNYSWRGQTKVNLYQVWDSDDENADEEAEQDTDPWSKLGNSMSPWLNTSNHADDGSWNSSNDESGWANFEDDFGVELCSQRKDTDSRLTLITNVDQISIADNFSKVSISEERRDQMVEQPVNDGWKGERGSNSNDEHAVEHIVCHQKYNCFAVQEKDCAVEMLNLEAICGNTLAEKIANAENDIRNEDEIRSRGFQEQALVNNYRLRGNFEETASVESTEYAVRVVVKNGNKSSSLSPSSPSSCEEKIFEQHECRHLSPTKDCLTKSSCNLATAENSASDTEISGEFADSENNPVVEFADKTDENPCYESAPAPTSDGQREEQNNALVDDGDASNGTDDKYNNIQKSEDVVVNHVDVMVENIEQQRAIVNGAASERAKFVSCVTDKVKEACDSCNSYREDLDNNVNSAVIEKPV